MASSQALVFRQDTIQGLVVAQETAASIWRMTGGNSWTSENKCPREGIEPKPGGKPGTHKTLRRDGGEFVLRRDRRPPMDGRGLDGGDLGSREVPAARPSQERPGNFPPSGKDGCNGAFAGKTVDGRQINRVPPGRERSDRVKGPALRAS